MRREYLIKISTAMILLAIGTITSIYIDNPAVLGLTSITSLLLYISARKISNIYGKTRNIRIFNTLTPNLTEFTSLITMAVFNPEPIVSAIVIGLVGLSIGFKSEVSKSLSKSVPEAIGRLERVSMLSIILLAGQFNEYFILYGSIGLITIVSASTTYTVYSLVSR